MLGEHDVKKTRCRDRIHRIFYKIQNSKYAESIIFMLGFEENHLPGQNTHNILQNTKYTEYTE